MSTKETPTIYSANGEDNWQVEIDDVANDLLSDNSSVDPKNITLYRGNKVGFSHCDFIDIDSIVERMKDGAIDQIGEFSYDYLEDMSQGKTAELNNIITAWFSKNITQPTFYEVKNITEISYATIEEN